MSKTKVTPRLYDVLSSERYFGKVVSLSDLGQRTGLTDVQVQNGMRSLVASGKYDMEVVIRGNAWRFNGPAGKEAPAPTRAHEDRTFSYVGRIASGETLVKGDTTDRVYVLTDLELGE